MVKELEKGDGIDRSYYDKLVDEAVKTISQYGDFEWFVSDDPYVPELVQMTLMSIVLFHGRCLAERISIGHASTARISTTITSTWIAILIMIFQIS